MAKKDSKSVIGLMIKPMSYSDPLFDSQLSRRGSNSIKWDFPELFSQGRGDAIPAWIAEMDFAAPSVVTDALLARASHQNYGYTWKAPELFDAVGTWFAKFGWDVKSKWITTTPGIMNAIAIAIRVYTKPGDTVVIDSPVYPPLHQMISNLGRKILFNQLRLDKGTYIRDFTGIEGRLPESTRMYILCNPHNPSGRVWSKEELGELGEFCVRNDLLIVTDEAYADLVLIGRHNCIASLDPSYGQRTITCVSPGKTYCVSGMNLACIIIPDNQLRANFVREKELMHLSLPDPFSIEVLKAAYLHSSEWLSRLKKYLLNNRNLAIQLLRDNRENIIPVIPEGTFLLWLDCRGIKNDYQTLSDLFLQQAGVLVSDGEYYGPGGRGFVRVHLGFPKEVIIAMLRQMLGLRM